MKLIHIALIIGIFSCSPPPSSSNPYAKHFDLKSEYIDRNFAEYSAIRQQAIDSVQSYIDDTLGYVGSLIVYGDWQIDSIFIFNTDSSRFYSKLYQNRSLPRNHTADCYDDFGGALIDGKWYFFKMGTFTVVPRDHYHHDPYEPLTFEELSYIAWRGAIPGLIYRRRSDGTLVTDHKAIDRMFFSTDRVWCPDSSRIRECKDSLILSDLSKFLGGKLSKSDILRIQEEIQNSKKPYVPPYKELTAWDRLLGKKEKLFDSEAWKNRYENK